METLTTLCAGSYSPTADGWPWGDTRRPDETDKKWTCPTLRLIRSSCFKQSEETTTGRGILARYRMAQVFVARQRRLVSRLQSSWVGPKWLIAALSIHIFRYDIWLQLLLCYTIPTIIPVIFWEETVLHAVLTQVFIRHVAMLNATWFVNSIAHTWGTRRYNKWDIGVINCHCLP